MAKYEEDSEYKLTTKIDTLTGTITSHKSIFSNDQIPSRF